MRKLPSAVILLALLGTAGCSKTLSRDEARERIHRELEFETMSVVRPQIIIAGSKTPEDREAKRFCGKYKLGTKLATATVEKVTGIALMSDQHGAIVEFQPAWQFDTEAGKEFAALPANVQDRIQLHTGRIAYVSGESLGLHAVTAQAVFVLYDDGWRLTQIR